MGKTIIKTIAILLNLGFLVFFIYMFIVNPEHQDAGDLLSGFLLFATLTINLFVIFSFKDRITKGDSWLNLFLKRKKVEEELRIKELEEKIR